MALCLSLKVTEGVWIDDHTHVVLQEIRGKRVRLAIEAPKEVPVHRDEVFEAIQAEKNRVAS